MRWRKAGEGAGGGEGGGTSFHPCCSSQKRCESGSILAVHPDQDDRKDDGTLEKSPLLRRRGDEAAAAVDSRRLPAHGRRRRLRRLRLRFKLERGERRRPPAHLIAFHPRCTFVIARRSFLHENTFSRCMRRESEERESFLYGHSIFKIFQRR